MENVSFRAARRGFRDLCIYLAEGEQDDFAVLEDGGAEPWLTVHAAGSATVPGHMRVAYELADIDWLDIEDSLWKLTQLGIEVVLKTTPRSQVYLRAPEDKLDQLGADALQLVIEQYAAQRVEQARLEREDALEREIIPALAAHMEATWDELLDTAGKLLARRAEAAEAILRERKRPAPPDEGPEPGQ